MTTKAPTEQQPKQYCILFYKYHPLTSDPALLETYRRATKKLCASLHLTGRILLGLSEDGEGINGTLAGGKLDVEAYVDCMLGREGVCSDGKDDGDVDSDGENIERRNDAIKEFRTESKKFFEKLNVPELIFPSSGDFKWSSWQVNGDKNNIKSSSSDNSDINGSWFPDLNIKLVKEIISSGGAFSNITMKDTAKGYLTPKEWHEEIKALVRKHEQKAKSGGDHDHNEGSVVTAGKDDENKDTKQDEDEEVETILIDVRNHKECQIGSFAPGIAIDPNTKTFSQFPKWVQDHTAPSDDGVNGADCDKISGDGIGGGLANKTKAGFGKAVDDAAGMLNNKRILLYCTGGIRCEKASAYVRQMVPNHKGVFHLQGGIHKYLEEFGNKGSVADENILENVTMDEVGETKAAKDLNAQPKELDECQFLGKNFVFDRRGALGADNGLGQSNNCHAKIEIEGGNATSDPGRTIVGKCRYCCDPWDVFLPESVCTVCREPILICPKCKLNLYQKQQHLRGITTATNESSEGKGAIGIRSEYHCEDHFHLKECYYTNLCGFSKEEMESQMKQLRDHIKPLEGLGKKGKQRRRTLRKKIDKIEAFLKGDNSHDNSIAPPHGNSHANVDAATQCRHCGSSECASDCWGFHGGNLRMKRKPKQGMDESTSNVDDESTIHRKKRNRTPSNQRAAKMLKREMDLKEIASLDLCKPPTEYRLGDSGMRVPPPVVRVLRSAVKGRWCGKTLGWVMANEFFEGDPSREGSSNLTTSIGINDENALVDRLVEAGLLRINGTPVSKLMQFIQTISPVGTSKPSHILLKNMDVIERVCHWHEPPVIVPPTISITKHSVPGFEDITNDAEGNPPNIFCIDKPPTVPVHPAGPYYANSLLMMVEAQEGLPPKSLIPCHRIDRATSGVLICTNMPSVASAVQGKISCGGKVKKLYLARVKGKFPASLDWDVVIPKQVINIASTRWCGDDNDILEVNAPIAVKMENKTISINSAMSASPMRRIVSSDGKPSVSRFRLIAYDEQTNQSLVSCCPITGRGHQLRVHLHMIGFPIQNDVEYGGKIHRDSIKSQMDLSVKSMLEVSASTLRCLHDDSITKEEIQMSVENCKCCAHGKEGVKASFNSSQLLGGSHAIDLHALKYCVSFGNVSKADDLNANNTMEFSTSIPSWATRFVDIASVERFHWLA